MFEGVSKAIYDLSFPICNIEFCCRSGVFVSLLVDSEAVGRLEALAEVVQQLERMAVTSVVVVDSSIGRSVSPRSNKISGIR